MELELFEFEIYLIVHSLCLPFFFFFFLVQTQNFPVFPTSVRQHLCLKGLHDHRHQLFREVSNRVKNQMQ